MIYFVQHPESKAIKIGYTQGFGARRQKLEQDQGTRLDVLGVAEGDRKTETGLHARFKHLRIRGEWFQPGGELLEHVKFHARPWVGDDETEVIRVPAALAKAIRVTAAFMNVSRIEYLSEHVLPLVEGHKYEAAVRELAKHGISAEDD